MAGHDDPSGRPPPAGSEERHRLDHVFSELEVAVRRGNLASRLRFATDRDGGGRFELDGIAVAELKRISEQDRPGPPRWWLRPSPRAADAGMSAQPLPAPAALGDEQTAADVARGLVLDELARRRD